MSTTKKAEKGKSAKGKGQAKHGVKAVEPADPIDRFRAPALKIREEAVQPCRADVWVAHANIQQGITSVFGAPEDPVRKDNIKAIKSALPELSVKKVLELPDLSHVLMLAAGRVAPPASTGEIDAKLAVVRDLREPVLMTAEVLALKGILSKEVVAKIRSGSGKYDTASDGAALYALFTANAGKLKGLHPFTDEELERMRAASQWLLDRLTPGGARPKAPPKKSEAEVLRDRLWTLVLERHGDLRVMGYYKFRDAFEKFTPKLQSRVAARRGESGEAPGGAPEGQGGEGSEGSGGSGGQEAPEEDES
jgi:hypothetical protein